MGAKKSRPTFSKFARERELEERRELKQEKKRAARSCEAARPRLRSCLKAASRSLRDRDPPRRDDAAGLSVDEIGSTVGDGDCGSGQLLAG
jgi:hypothetical protein